MSNRCKLLALPLLLVAAQARGALIAVGPPAAPRRETPVAPAPQGCVESVSSDPTLDEALRALTVEVGGEPRPLAGLRIIGLTTVPEDELWKLLGGRPVRPDPHQVTVLVRRLLGLRLFARVVPVVRVSKDATVSVDIAVTEQPRVRQVVFEGLTEVRPERLLEPLLRASDDDGDHPAAGACVASPVPAGWLARSEGAAVQPGILREGPQPALTRLVHALYQLGYEMAAVTATLPADGVLTITVDEGRLEAVEIRGVSPRIEPQVRGQLDLHVGRPLQVGELHQALGRVRAVFPFLRAGRARPGRLEPTIQEEATAGGVRRFRTVEEPPPAPAAAHATDDDGDDDDDDWSDGDDGEGRFYTVEGRRLVVTLATQRFDLDLDASELLRHTPVTGFAPGLVGSARLWDPANEVHVGLDLAGNVNTNSAHRPVVDPAIAPQQWRVDWLVGARMALPRVHVAELGVQRYSRVDTSDRWRIDRIDSYLYSALFNRPNSDYFHRDGLTAFITTQWLERLLAGVEYRQDRYASLQSIDRYFTLFYRHEPPRFTPPVTEGEMRSILLRVEYSTQPTPSHQVHGIWRDPERALAYLSGHERWHAELRTVNTVEIADPALLGGDQSFRFVRMVSDTVVEEPVREHHRIKIRFRAAGRLGDGTLPPQKEEALGGWIALRGYDFKELASGSFSLLGTIEYRYREISVFFDGGQVRRGGEFGALRVSAGLALNLGDSAHLDVAWRLDDRAHPAPAARFFFNRTF
jgi:hypothetical protein